MERWRQVPDFPGYEVSDLGRVRSSYRTKRPRLLNPQKTSRGYARVSLYNTLGSQSRYVHGLVLLAFVGPRPEGFHGAHLNGDPMDNHLENLAWVTPAENEAHKVAHGTHYAGDGHHKTKITDEQALDVLWGHRIGCISQRQLAQEYGVAKATIFQITSGARSIARTALGED